MSRSNRILWPLHGAMALLPPPQVLTEAPGVPSFSAELDAQMLRITQMRRLETELGCTGVSVQSLA